MSSSISAAELDEWIAFYNLEPFGDWAAWQRNSMQMALLANVNRDPKKTKPFGLADFMPASSAKRPAAISIGDSKMQAKLVRGALESVFAGRIAGPKARRRKPKRKR